MAVELITRRAALDERTAIGRGSILARHGPGDQPKAPSAYSMSAIAFEQPTGEA
jgi:hypothetical protein